MPRKCTECNRTKKLHLFPKPNIKRKTPVNTNICKSCSKKARQAIVTKTKEADWHLWKARSLRSNWLARARKLQRDKKEVPIALDIAKWLKQQEPFKCYITDNPILNRDRIELDHKNPTSNGGVFNLVNVGITTKDTNLLKGTMLEEDYKSLLELVSTWEDKGNALFKVLRMSRSVWKR